jgi:hypothetical protein
MAYWLAAVVAAFLILAFFRAPILLWTIVLAALAWWLHPAAGAAVLALLGTFCIPPLRRVLFSNRVLAIYRRILPDMSQTEKEAIDAGTVWWDADLFSGRPDWDKLLAIPAPRLSPEEQAFVDGPTEELCAMCDDWEITHERYDLPPRVWQFVKDKGFLGMIIPKKYGGLGFSALARPRRAAAPLRHRGAEEPLPAAPREGPRDPVLRAHQPRGGLGRGLDPRLRRGLQGRVAGQGNPRHARHLGQALHHARPGSDASRAGVPAL